MTDLDNAATELDIESDELTVKELDAASGGRIKIYKPPAVLALEIAKCQAENPGFC